MGGSIILIGFRAVGETTVGRSLARRTGFTFVDTDHVIISRKESSIANFVAREGWDAFRRFEKSVLEDFVGMQNAVIATGGGAIVHEPVWRRLRHQAFVVWLTASTETILDRLLQDEKSAETRPALTDGDIVGEIKEKLAEREALYHHAAEYSIATDVNDVEQTVSQIIAAYHRWLQTGRN